MLTDEKLWAIANNFFTIIANDNGTDTWRDKIADTIRQIEENAIKEDRAQTVEALEAQKKSLSGTGQHIIEGVNAGLYVAQNILRGEN